MRQKERSQETTSREQSVANGHLSGSGRVPEVDVEPERIDGGGDVLLLARVDVGVPEVPLTDLVGRGVDPGVDDSSPVAGLVHCFERAVVPERLEDEERTLRGTSDLVACWRREGGLGRSGREGDDRH